MVALTPEGKVVVGLGMIAGMVWLTMLVSYMGTKIQ